MKNIFHIALYLTLVLLVAIYLPKDISIYYENRTALIGFALLGTWRYSWWAMHVVRALIYRCIIFPKRRLKANELWQTGWRPKRLFILMTTFKELQTTTEIVLQSIINESKELNVTVYLFIGTGSLADETNINNYLALKPCDLLSVYMVRQIQPGKRFAISLTLQAIIAHGLSEEDIVVFMDGDTFFVPGCLRQCLPFFPLFPHLQALTTHEQSQTYHAPKWMEKWLTLRFAQRDLTMQSYALSNKLLTLTGRMSIFRGKHLLERGFIEMIECDHLNHWLWGDFRFLSGDDKSTWYYLLKAKAEMFYILDATTITIECIQGNAFIRMKENLKRWCGNTLRNGARAIALGPNCTGIFIWWCLIDQRIAIWTMPIGIMITLLLAITKTPFFLLATVVWIAFSRFISSVILFYHARRIDIFFPFILYFNQLMSSIIKIYILFRLPQQRWENRGKQSTGFNTQKHWKLRNFIAHYLTLFYCCIFLLLSLLYLNIISMPTLEDMRVLFF